MVTGLLALAPRFTAEVMAAELVTGVAEAELCTLLASGFKRKKKEAQKKNTIIIMTRVNLQAQVIA